MKQEEKDMFYSAGAFSGGFGWDQIKDVANSFIAVLSIALDQYLEYTGLSSKSFNMLAILLVADTVTGRIKAHSLGSFIRRKFWFGILVKMLFLLVPVVIKAMTEFANVQGLVLFNTYCILIAAHETESFFGNLYTIRTGKILPEKDILSLVFKKMYEILGDFLKKFTQTDSNQQSNEADN